MFQRFDGKTHTLLSGINPSGKKSTHLNHVPHVSLSFYLFSSGFFFFFFSFRKAVRDNCVKRNFRLLWVPSMALLVCMSVGCVWLKGTWQNESETWRVNTTWAWARWICFKLKKRTQMAISCVLFFPASPLIKLIRCPFISRLLRSTGKDENSFRARLGLGVVAFLGRDIYIYFAFFVFPFDL